MLILAACGGPREAAREVPPFSPECVLLPPPPSAADTLSVALLDRVDPRNAPAATNPGEELVFAQFYEALTTADCLGEARPALATSWDRDASGIRWTFHLDRNARYWDGTLVAAADFANRYGEPSVLPSIDSLVARCDHVLDVYFHSPHHDDGPPQVTSRMFGAKESDSWSIGSGRLAPIDRTAKAIVSGPGGQHEGTEAKTYVTFFEYAGTDPRDVLARQVDLLVTSDPMAVEYAASQARLVTRPLPWDRTYLLVSRSRFDALRAGETVGEIGAEQLRTLARDAVRVDARGHDRTGWWADFDDCRTVGSAAPGDLPRPLEPARHGLVIYEKTDPVAGRLAERVVALAAGGGATDPGLHHAIPRLSELALATQALEPSEMSERLRTGQDFLYVVSLPLRPPDPCTAGTQFLERAPWLAHLGNDFGGATIGLVDTRRHVIADSSRVGVVVDWFGGIRIITEKMQGDRAP